MTTWDDKHCQTLLVRFAKDYYRAQHPLKVSEFAGGAAFEILLTIVLMSATAGAGVAIRAVGNARLVRQMTQLGELFKELAGLRKEVGKYTPKTRLRSRSTGNMVEDLPDDDRPVARAAPPPKGEKKNRISEKEINSFGIYSTLIDDKVTVIEKNEEVPDWIQESFLDSKYRTVITKEAITVYRVYGGSAGAQGAFVSTTPALNKIQVKVEAALLPEWKNTRAYEAEILIPKGTKLDIGKVAPQTINSTGTILKGQADQLLMPQDWSKEWIKNVRSVNS